MPMGEAGDGDNVGGLVGYLDNGGITSSYATGDPDVGSWET